MRTFIEEQAVFFVATAPLAEDGHVNVSPKGRAGSLAMLDEHTVAFLDFGGSDTCGFAVPYMELREERTLHADYFGRKTDDEFAAYCEGKVTNRASIDGRPAPPLPLPPWP